MKLSKAVEKQQKQFGISTNAKVAVARQQIADGEIFDGDSAMNEIIAELSTPTTKKRKWKQWR